MSELTVNVSAARWNTITYLIVHPPRKRDLTTGASYRTREVEAYLAALQAALRGT